MPTIPFTISLADLTIMIEALSTRWGWTPDNGRTKEEFVRQQIGERIRQEVRDHRLATARQAVTVSDITIT